MTDQEKLKTARERAGEILDKIYSPDPLNSGDINRYTELCKFIEQALLEAEERGRKEERKKCIEIAKSEYQYAVAADVMGREDHVWAKVSRKIWDEILKLGEPDE